LEAEAHAHDHHELPTSGRALDALALSATLHCLTGCAIGEVSGMIIGTALDWSEWATVALAVALAFLFGYTLTSVPLLRGGLALGAVIPIALASDTISIAIMEVVDNAIMLAIPGAMEAGLDNTLFWGSLSVALAVAGFAAYPVNRWLLQHGRGHAAVHQTGIHGGPSPRVVGRSLPWRPASAPSSWSPKRSARTPAGRPLVTHYVRRAPRKARRGGCLARGAG
jgi:Domain of unknown function (DUF4396)